MLSIILKVLLAMLTVTFVTQTVYAERRNLNFVMTIWSRFRVQMFFEVFGMLLVTILFCALLMQCPLFKYGWMDLFFVNGGSLFIAPVIDAAGASNHFARILPFMFILFLLVAMPFWARNEEKSFREGNYEWPDIIKESIVFGLVHCLMGVPLGAGIVLIGVGFFYACKYRKTFLKELDNHGNWHRAEKEAVLVSTTYHTLYNTMVVFVLTVAMWQSQH